MHLYKVCVSKDNAWQSIETLGCTKAAHFLNLNEGALPFSLPYTQMVKKCSHLRHQLDKMGKHFSKCDQPMGESPSNVHQFN